MTQGKEKSGGALNGTTSLCSWRSLNEWLHWRPGSGLKSRLMMGMMAMFLQIGTGDVEDILRLTLIHAAAQKLGIDPRCILGICAAVRIG
jgi:hypothetical protein